MAMVNGGRATRAGPFAAVYGVDGMHSATATVYVEDDDIFRYPPPLVPSHPDREVEAIQVEICMGHGCTRWL